MAEIRQNENDLKDLLADPQISQQPGWKPEESLVQSAAMAMQLKEGMDFEKDALAWAVLDDIERVWKLMYSAADDFADSAQEIRRFVRDRRLLDRIDAFVRQDSAGN